MSKRGKGAVDNVRGLPTVFAATPQLPLSDVRGEQRQPGPSSRRVRPPPYRAMQLLRFGPSAYPDVPSDPLDAMLGRLQLTGIRDQLDSLLDEAARSNLSAHKTLVLLCEREIARKDHRRIEMALSSRTSRR